MMKTPKTTNERTGSSGRTIAGEVIADLLRQYPDAPTKTLARKAYADHPRLWNSLEHCRNRFRYYRGANGTHDRESALDPSLFREPQQPGDPFDKIPEPAAELEAWKVVEIPGPAKVACLSDVHVPYHDREAVIAALKYCRDRGADLVLLNGDLMDDYALSDFEKDPRKKDYPAEIDTAHEFLAALREGFPKARIIFKDGNHEERYRRYLRLKCMELLGIPEFEFPNLLHLAKMGIDYITNRCPIKVGDLFFLHGHEYRFAITNPVNPARGLFLRSIGVHAVAGHFHQTSQHSARSLSQSVISTWSTGCLCGLHPEYSPLNNWNAGFLFAEIDAKGAFNIDNLRIIHGHVHH